MRRLGVIVNPVAGIGGSVGLKGSDGLEVLAEALERGAVSPAPKRAKQALEALSSLRDQIEVVTAPLEMGESEARTAGFTPTVVGPVTQGRPTTAGDTRAAALEMERLGVDLLLFAGGDGTANDLLAAVGRRVTMLGIPAGVKMHSAVFAITPRRAGQIALMALTGDLLDVVEAEVMDAHRDTSLGAALSPELHGYLRVPRERLLVQELKSASPDSEAAAQQSAARAVLDRLPEQAVAFVGPGTTTAAVSRLLGLQPTLSGVDVIRARKPVLHDAGERELISLAQAEDVFVVVTPIGGQGFLFGRGNQQLSARVLGRISRDQILIVATPAKLASLTGRPLLVDTGDDELNEVLSGYMRVITAEGSDAIYRVAS